MNKIFDKSILYEKSIFYYLLATILGFSFLGFGVSEAFKNYFYSEKNQFMTNQAIEISEIFRSDYSNYKKNGVYLSDELSLLDEYSSYSFFITDTDYNVILVSQDIHNINVNDKINFNKAYEVSEGNTVFSSDTFNNIFSSMEYYLAYPIMSEGNTLAIVFVTTSLSKLHSSISKIYVLCIIFILIASIIGFAVLSITMSRTISDITELNKAAKRIADGNFKEKIKIKGNDELSQLAKSFNEMAQSLDENEKTQQEFLSNIAHDLRSPITSIIGFLDAILDNTIPPDKTNKYLNIIKSETDRLNKLTNSIMDLNKIRSINLELIIKNFDINQLIINTAESMRSRIVNKSLNVIFEFEPESIIVSADYEKIHRVLYNLFDNAIKFSNTGGTIITKVFIENNKANISLKNTGAGLTEEECRKVFDRLYKTDSSRGIDKTGMGLGLSIVKSFINLHNENINVSSKYGEYTVFTFTLPIKTNTSA